MTVVQMVSVITVTRNDPAGLKITLDSIPSDLDAGKLEVIVVDGSDDSGSVVANQALCNGRPWVRYSYGLDGGIYDAMNRGISLTRGEWMWFLNGGDSAVDVLGILNLLSRQPSVDPRANMLTCGYILASGTRNRAVRAKSMWRLFHGLPTSHQAIIYRSDAVRSVGGYRLKFDIVGDYDLTCRIYRSDPGAWAPSSVIAASFEVGGTSFVRGKEIAGQARRVQEEVLELPKLLLYASAILHRIARLRRTRWASL